MQPYRGNRCHMNFFWRTFFMHSKKKKMHLLFKHFALKCRRAFSSYVLAFHQAAPGEPASPQTFYHPHLWRERDTA